MFGVQLGHEERIFSLGTLCVSDPGLMFYGLSNSSFLHWRICYWARPLPLLIFTEETGAPRGQGVLGWEGLCLGLWLPSGWSLEGRAADQGNGACVCLFFLVTFQNPIK